MCIRDRCEGEPDRIQRFGSLSAYHGRAQRHIFSRTASRFQGPAQLVKGGIFFYGAPQSGQGGWTQPRTCLLYTSSAARGRPTRAGASTISSSANVCAKKLATRTFTAVSYTHLDVYKRQAAVEKICLFFVGTVVLRSMMRVPTPPMVSMPREDVYKRQATVLI